MRRVVIYGGGVSALRAALELAGQGIVVELVSPIDPASWPSLPDGGISIGDDPDALIADTLACGRYLAARAPVRSLCRSATVHMEELAAMGVPFTRDGTELALRRLPGSSRARAAWVEARTEQAIESALWSQLLRHHGSLVTVREPFDLVALAVHDGHCAGLITRNRVTGDLVEHGAEAVLLACGGPERLMGARGAVCLEGPLAVAAAAGAVVANADLWQLHPAAIETPRGVVVPSGALRAEGARLWVPSAEEDDRAPLDIPRKDRLRFLEESHPGWAELVPDDLAARGTQRIVTERGIYNPRTQKREAHAYLDLTHLPEGHLRARLDTELFACVALSGVDPALEAMRVAPRAQGMLGGLWVDFAPKGDALDESSPRNHATSVMGLFAAGPIACLYHGGCRLGGQGALADLHGGWLAARAMSAHLAGDAVDSDETALAEARDGVRDEIVDAEEQRAMSRALRELGQAALGPASFDATNEDRDTWAKALTELGEAAGPEVSQMLLVARLALASARARAAEATVLARVDGENVSIIDGFDCRGRRVTGAIDHDGIAPAPRAYAEAP